MGDKKKDLLNLFACMKNHQQNKEKQNTEPKMSTQIISTNLNMNDSYFNKKQIFEKQQKMAVGQNFGSVFLVKK